MLFSKKCAERREAERKTNLQLAMSITNLNERLEDIVELKSLDQSESIAKLEAIRAELSLLSASLRDLIIPLSRYFEFETKQMETINAELMTKPGRDDDRF